MRKTKQVLLLLLVTCYFLLAANDVFAQNQSVLKFRSGTGTGGQPGVFMPPFRCGLTYWGWTYPGHSAYSVDFNRGSGYDDYGDPVLASANGTVGYVLRSHGEVQISHAGGYETVYVHMQKITVGVGDTVQLGQKIGEIGDAGAPGQSHLHVNHLRNGVRIQVAYNKVPYPASVPVNTIYRWGPRITARCQ